MPFYDLECKCGAITEFMMGMNDVYVTVKCPECDCDMTRKQNRIPNVPQLNGDINNQYEYFDENLGSYISNKTQRKEIMERKGLVEYSPDPTMKKHRDEARKIRNDSLPGDPQATEAIRKEYKTAGDKRRNRLVRASMEKSFKSAQI